MWCHWVGSRQLAWSPAGLVQTFRDSSSVLWLCNQLPSPVVSGIFVLPTLGVDVVVVGVPRPELH